MDILINIISFLSELMIWAFSIIGLAAGALALLIWFLWHHWGDK